MILSRLLRIAVLLMTMPTLFFAPWAYADIVVDWNIKAVELSIEAKAPAGPANRALAIVHTAVYEAANAISKRYPASALKLEPTAGASIEAAIAAANRGTLLKFFPTQQAVIEASYQAALAAIADDQAKSDGVAVGEKAAAAVLASRADDVLSADESYRPHTTAGVYVPTVIPVFVQWSARKPWLMNSPAQFRPGPPPKLSSALWARDYNEIKTMGAKNGSRRSAEQTDIARFWEATGPAIYHGVVRSVANMPGRDLTQNARLFAAVTQASDDALIAVFDGKYHYGFWRPITAIRNADKDGNKATERDPSWLPFIDTPMHPEYPCAHCISASALGTVIRAEIGTGPMPVLSTNSPTAKGAARSWTSIDAFIQEVSEARIYDGVHYRNSTEVANAMGRKIGALAVDRWLRPAR
ncbi:MAG TPA: vanadium-dependent haloperoxidase [Usitatibacteraceae bacterium]